MLEFITIKDFATYDDTGVDIENLKKINFIYGANGSGKTTISKFIVEPSATDFKHCLLKWKSDFPVKALVFNKDFREKHFGNGNTPGVFTLGQATKEQIEAIAVMQDELGNIKIEGFNNKKAKEKLQVELLQCEAEFKEQAWNGIYKHFENDFIDAFIGLKTKEKFKARLLNELKSKTEPFNEEEELKEKSKVLFGEAPKEIPLLPSIDYTGVLEIESSPLWKRKIVGKSDIDIARLIQKLNLSDWVNEGRSYLQQDDNICPFCQQPTITQVFRQQIEDYFDESFSSDIDRLKNDIEEYDQRTKKLTDALSAIENAEKANVDTKLDVEKVSSYSKALSSHFISNKERLKNKIKEPSRSVELLSSAELLKNIYEVIEGANVEVREHNHIVTHYKSEKRNLISSVWKYLAEQNRSKIESYLKQSNGKQQGINNLEKQYGELRVRYREKETEIREANKNVTSVQPSVDEINRTLQFYGFSNFKVVRSKEEKGQYQIQREDGSIAESTLSEGEMTFITFLYFLQLAKGSAEEETITDDRILVIDDPVSSLDSNVLFVVSSLLKGIIKKIRNDEGNIKQLILLTHNVYFHKEVSFIDGRNKKRNDTFYWVLRKNGNTSSIQCFGMETPIHSSYELLWHELRECPNLPCVSIQNTMRRIIEYYFKLLGKYEDDEIITKFENRQEQEVCRSLFCWINEGSHGITDDLYVEYGITSATYLKVFRKIFEVTRHIEHYDMMMSNS